MQKSNSIVQFSLYPYKRAEQQIELGRNLSPGEGFLSLSPTPSTDRNTVGIVREY